ncbi:MAG TPA: DUF3786 domain-containing protein [Anaerolineales bacterium]|nr:DUF3786 domain-containing protein [Anaerolineales bacterium]
MLAEIERIRGDVRAAAPDRLAACVGGTWHAGALRIDYWGRPAHIDWVGLMPRGEDGEPLSAFDQAMLLYHLRQSDGTRPAGRWIGFRELPGGEFYHRAYQGYTGRRLAEAYGTDPERFDAAAAPIGTRLDGPAPHAWSFTPLPRIALAACLWPGDDEMPSQASVLFDAHAGHHLPIDGLALLGAGLTGRLLRATPPPR